MQITGQSALPKEDIDRMVKDAEQYAEEDRRRREEADARNNADNLLYQTEKLVKENDEKIGPELRAKVEEAQGKVREALGGSDVAAIKSASDELSQVSQEVGQALYAAGAQDEAGAQTQASATGSEEEDIVDAEVVDEDDDSEGRA